MVSLSDNRQAARYFDAEQGSINYSSSDELLSDHIELSASVETPFQPVKTVWTAVLWILILVSLTIECYILPTVCTNDTCVSVPILSVFAYSHSGTWFLIYLVDRFICYQHNISRRNGYLEFYRRTCALRKVPIMVFSAGCAIFVISLTIVHDYCKDDHCNAGLSTSPIVYLQILVTLEVAVIIPCIFVYIVRTMKFNRLEAEPDVKEESTSAFLLSQIPTTEIGFKDEGFVDEILEKQADMIRYLKQHCTNLSKKILKLTTQLNSRPGSHH